MSKKDLKIEWYYNADNEIVVCDGQAHHFSNSVDNAKILVLLFKICKRLGIKELV